MPSRRIFTLAAFFLIVLGSGLVYAQGPLTTKDLNAFSWRNIGPWTFSGRITDFAVPKGQSQTYYVATASAGLWKTEDGGISFSPIFENYGTLSMGNVEVAPSDPNIIYLGTGEAMHARSSTHGKGVWKSTDAGKTWTHIGLEKSFYIPRLAIDAKNPDIVYVAAEGQLYDNEMTSQRGLFKTTDGGKTWANVTAGVLKDRGVGDFVIDPANSEIIIASAYKTYRRSWTFIDRQPENHLYKSVDGGKTWKKLTQGLPLDIKSGWNGLAIYPKNPKIVYVRMDEEVDLGFDLQENRSNLRPMRYFRDGFDFEQFKTFKIDSRLAKLVKFEPVKADDERGLADEMNKLIGDKEFQKKLGIDIAAFERAARQVYQKDEDILKMMDEMRPVLEMKEPTAEEAKKDTSKAGRYQVINRYILQLLYGPALSPMVSVKKSGVIYRSDDQGETWKKMTDYQIVGGSAVVNSIEAGYAGRIEIDPNDENKIYAVETRVMVSDDGGKIFKTAPWNGNNQCHVDTRGIWIDPLNSNHILNGNDGGVSETWDGGKHWSQKETISAQQFYDVSVDNEIPYNVMGGTQDNGCWMGPSRNRNQYGVFPADWTYLPSGDGFYVVRDWWNPDWIYFESQFGASRRMNLKTGETSGLAPRLTDEDRKAGRQDFRYQWDAPIVLSPHNPGIVYVTSQYVHRSLQRGDQGTFEVISPDLTKADPKRIAESKLTNLQYATIYTFAESPVKPGVYWAGTDDGNLQMSKDGGISWTNITDKFYDGSGRLKKDRPKGAVLPYDHWVVRVEPSNHDVNVCYVAYSGYRTHSEDTSYVFVTRDMGQTWEDLSGGMMNPVWDIEEDPDNPSVLYLGTDYGLFVSIDGGKSWAEMSDEAPDVIIMDMDIQKRDRDLALASYGRGFYVLDIFPFKEFKPEVFEKNAVLFEPQPAMKWAMIERRGPSYGEFAKAPNPPSEAAFYYFLKDKVKSAKIVIKDLEGAVLQELRVGTEPGLRKVSWNLQRRQEPGAAGGQFRGGGGGFGGGRSTVDAGFYNVTLVIDDKDVVTKKLEVVDDPILK